MRIHSICLLLVLPALAVNSSGCLLVAAGAGAAGTVAYMEGDFEGGEPYALDEVFDATLAAAETLELSVLDGKTEKDALSATIVARDAQDKRVTVRLKAAREDYTTVSIRVGTFGDQTKQHRIYHQIRDNLRGDTPQVAQSRPSPVATRKNPSTAPPTTQVMPYVSDSPPAALTPPEVPEAPPVPPDEYPATPE